MKKFWQCNSIREMSSKQKDAFERSYKSYEKHYNKIKNPMEDKLSKDEYLQEYRSLKSGLEELGYSQKSLPRDIAREQKYERSLFQDVKQLEALQNLGLQEYQGMRLSKFRRLDTETLNKSLFDSIKQDKQDFLKLTDDQKMELAGTTDVNIFISKYYFGSE